MRKLNRINYVRLFLLIPFMVLFMSCEKIDENKVKIPLVTFETSQISVNTETGSYDVVLKLSEVASKELTIKVGMSGSATENEHYTVASKEIKIPVGTSEGKLPITILH